MGRARTLFVGVRPDSIGPTRWEAVVSALARASVSAGLLPTVVDDRVSSLAGVFVRAHVAAGEDAPNDVFVEVHLPRSRAQGATTIGANAVCHVYDADHTGALSMQAAALDGVACVVLVGGDADDSRLARIAQGRGLVVLPLRSLEGAAREFHDERFGGASDALLPPTDGAWTVESSFADATALATAVATLEVGHSPRSYFISYAREDSDAADRVEVILRRRKRRVFRDEEWFKAGKGLASEITEAIAMADDVVVIDSQAAADSEWVEKEVAFALAVKARRGDRMRIVGILTEGYPPRTKLDETLIHLLGTSREERQLAVWSLVDSEPTLSLWPPTALPVARTLTSFSTTLIDWPRTLGDGTTIKRPEFDAVVAAFKEEDPSTLLLLGAPGSGKSALLAELALAMQGEGREVCALKVDRLPRHIDSLEKLSTWAGVRSIVESLRLASTARPTVLLVDQLDSLGSLVDLQTGRLGAVLDLLAAVDGMPNLRIVASCRPFEFNHDARFARLRAKPITLELPTWDQVAAIVARGGHDAGRIPPRLRELLRVPQYLKVFLDLATPALGADTYEAMLEQLWQQKVSGDDDRITLLARVAEVIAEDEDPLVPLALADRTPRALAELVASGILRREGSGIAFAHQTLFEFAHARAFAQGGETLDAYVLRRQDGLFVRPVLWTALSYLRGARPAEYRRVYLALFDNGSVRQHIRVLLAEFLGQIDGASDEEVVWFQRMLPEPLLRRAAIAAMSGSRSWFGTLKRSLLGSLLEAPYATELMGVLGDAARNEPAEVVVLLRTYAGGWASGDRIALQILRSLSVWDDDAVALAADVVVRVEERWEVEGLIAAAVDANPNAGIRIFARAVATKLERAIASTVPEPDAWRSARATAVADALGTSESLIDWSALASSSAELFANTFLPILILAADAAATAPRGPNEFSSDAILDQEHEPSSQLAFALEKAMRTLAESNVVDFHRLLASAVQSTAMAIHRIVARALVELPEGDRAAAGTAYLLADPRRLAIASGTDRDGETVDFLRRLGPVLSLTQVEKLESAIRSYVAWPMPAEIPVLSRRRNLVALRRCRAQLLNALPEDMVSEGARQLIREHPVEVYAPSKPFNAEFTEVRSAMSGEQMARAKDEHILHYFAELTDGTMWRHPRRFDVGGAIVAARALATLADKDPGRLARLVTLFRPGTQETPVGDALVALAKSGLEPDAWEALVLECDRRGFSKVGFREDVARGVTDHAVKCHGASDALVTMLSRWLIEPGAPDDEEEPNGRTISRMPSPKAEEAPAGERRPILSGFVGGGLFGLPHESYPVLHALFAALMMRPEPETERWLTILEAHLGREPSAAVWTAVALELDHAWRLADRPRVERFFDALLNRHPSIVETAPGALLLAQSLSWLSAAFLAQWLARLQCSPAAFARQLAGELGVYASLRGLITISSEMRLTAGDASVDERAGIAFAAAQVWDHAVHRPRATGLLLACLRDVDPEVQSGALRVFQLRDELPGDAASAQLLDELVRRDDLMARVPEQICGALSSLLPAGAARVAEVAEAFVRAAEDERRKIMAEAGPALADLTLTLQRLQAFRARGVSLFERLQRLGVYGVGELLFDLDGRIRRQQVTITSRRRFPRKPRRR